MSSKYMHAENAICTIVEAMLPRGTNERLGLYLTLNIDAIDYSDTIDQKIARKGLEFIFVRPSNYTQVYVKEHAKWELHSDHYSCWRSDGLRKIFTCVSDVCKKIAPNKPFAEANPKITLGNSIKYVLLKERVGDKIFGHPQKMVYYYDKQSREVTNLFIENILTLKEAIPYLQEDTTNYL